VNADYGTLRPGDCEVDWSRFVSLLFHPSGIIKIQSNLHIPSTWFLVLFNVLLFHSLQFVPDVFGLLVMFGMELEGYNFNLILYFLLSDLVQWVMMTYFSSARGAHLNILYWHRNSSSTVPVEQMFSTTGIIMNSKRCILSEDKLHRISFIHDNIKLLI